MPFRISLYPSQALSPHSPNAALNFGAACASSRWPRSPSHGKCSRRFCGSSRSYGRSHHQRQRETSDVMHSRATDRRSAPKCQGKWLDQTLDQAFGLPEVLVAVSTSRLSCKRAGKTRTFDAGLGFIWGNLGFKTAFSPGKLAQRTLNPLFPELRGPKLRDEEIW